MTYLEHLEIFLSSLNKSYEQVCGEERELEERCRDLNRDLGHIKNILKDLKQLSVRESNKYREHFNRYYEESVAIHATLSLELKDSEKKKDEVYRHRFDLDWRSKRLLSDKIEMMKKVGLESDLVNLYFDFYMDSDRRDKSSMVMDGRVARFNSSRYVNLSNFDNKDLGVELEGNIMRHQIVLGAQRKASKVMSVGFRDKSLYMIVLDLLAKKKTTIILRDDGEFASVETHKYDPKIKSYFLRTELDEKIPRGDVMKAFFNLLDLGV